MAVNCPNVLEISKLPQFPVFGRIKRDKAGTIRQSPSEDLRVKTDNLKDHAPWFGQGVKAETSTFCQAINQTCSCVHRISFDQFYLQPTLLIKLLFCVISKQTQPVWSRFIQWFMEAGYFLHQALFIQYGLMKLIYEIISTAPALSWSRETQI